MMCPFCGSEVFAPFSACFACGEPVSEGSVRPCGCVEHISSDGRTFVRQCLKHQEQREFEENPKDRFDAGLAPVILDTRTPEEYYSGHITGAIFVPTPKPPLDSKAVADLERNLKAALVGVPKDTPIDVYCKKGIRAGKALEILRSLGYGSVRNLGGVETTPGLAGIASSTNPHSDASFVFPGGVLSLNDEDSESNAEFATIVTDKNVEDKDCTAVESAMAAEYLRNDDWQYDDLTEVAKLVLKSRGYTVFPSTHKVAVLQNGLKKGGAAAFAP